VDYLLSATGGGAQDGEHRAIRQAVIHGVREVLHARNWLWHTKTGYFTTQQINTTATIQSGSSTITVASAAGIVVGRMLEISPTYFSHPVRVTAINGTSITLDSAAKADGSLVPVLVQTYYDLPSDLKDVDALVTDTVGTLHCYITPQEWQRLEVNTRGSGEPFYYTIMRSDVNPDRFQVRFVGVPTNSTVMHFTYRYQPKMVKYMGYEPLCRQGTVQIAPVGGQSAVVGAGTEFQTDMVGSMLRVGTANHTPEPIGALRPFVAEGKIRSVTNATTLLADSSLGTVSVATKYAISDIIDCSPQMYTAVLSAAEMWYARLAGRPGKDVIAMFNRDLRLAMERDVVSPLSGQPSPIGYPTPRTMGYYSSQLPDQE
jgi:hypothetical protein